MKNNSSEIRNQGYCIIGVLVHSCLLQEAPLYVKSCLLQEAPQYVKVHDVIRHMLLWIACEVEEKK